MALGKYGPAAYDFRPVDADVYDTRGTAKVPTFINSTGTAGLPKIDAAGRVEFWVEAGDYHLLLTTPDGDTVTESIQVAPGGTADPTDPNAASSACWFHNTNRPAATNLSLLTMAPITDGIAAGTDVIVDPNDASLLKVVTASDYDVQAQLRFNTYDLGVATNVQENTYIVLNDDSVGPAYFFNDRTLITPDWNGGTLSIMLVGIPLAAGDTLRFADLGGGLVDYALWAVCRRG